MRQAARCSQEAPEKRSERPVNDNRLAAHQRAHHVQRKPRPHEPAPGDRGNQKQRQQKRRRNQPCRLEDHNSGHRGGS